MANNKAIKIVVIVGPTASGKSDLALRLVSWLRSGRIAKQFVINGSEIISADSRQVYRGMNIGTGKVSKKEQKIAKHHLIDVANPKKQFTADDFKKLGQKAIQEIMAKNKIPIIVGGTGFYVDALLDRTLIAHVPPNQKLRIKLEKQSLEKLYSRLLALDPRRAETIDRENKRRLIRALEIILTTGKPVPVLNNESEIKNYEVLWIGLKSVGLEKRIKRRLDTRLRQGMIKEVVNLHKKGVSWKRLDDFGLEYRQIAIYLKHSKQTQSAKSQTQNFKKSWYYEKLLREIIKYSKRQMTWFKRNKNIHWVNPLVGGKKEAIKLASDFLHNGDMARNSSGS